MYRLLIADDEALEREGLEWIVRRAMPDTFQMIFAENGRRALELADEHRPHIIFMDIHMPGIQGLEALRRIRDRMPDVKLVLVTAYDYFAYAQEAIAIGVKEYIVKPASREQITALLQRLVQELDHEKQSRNERLQLIDRLSELEPLMENELALMFMVDQIIGAEAEQLAEWIRFPLDDGFAVVAAWAELPAEPKERRTLFEEVRAFAKSLGACLVSSIIDRHMALFFSMPKEGAASPPSANTIGRRLAQWTAERLNQPASIGVGVQHSGIEGLRRSYVEAVFASSCCSSGGGLCLFAELQRSSPGADPVAAAGSVDGSAGQTAAEADEATKAYVLSALRRSREMREHQTISALDRARAYIESHFTEDLSLEEVADHVHLNSFYLSKVFKQYVGETFIDFLTSLRIKRAKQLIEEDTLSLKEICYEAGYKDPNYFSRVFKKVTGVTPSDYRTSSLKESDS